MPRLHLLGAASLRAPDGLVDLQLQYRKGWALLGYLAVERGRRHPREHLAGLLWPNLDTAAARTNLRQVLSNLQRVFGALGMSDLLHADKSSVGLLPAVPTARLFDIDLLDPLIIAEDDVVELLLHGRAWEHRGVFLDGVSVADSQDFEEWLGFTREHFLRREIRLLGRLRDRLRGLGRIAGAIDVAWRIVRIDGWNESHHRVLMCLLAEDDALHEVRRVYADLERNLRTHLDCAPSAATRELRSRLLRDDVHD